MPKKPSEPNQLPKDVIDHWPEVFEDLDVKVVPLEYLHSVRVFFEDGKVWDIDIQKSKKDTNIDHLEATLEELFESYDDVIVNVDFRLDTERLKKDITNRTQLFLKKRK